jgi:hypothetical protein
MHKKLVFIALVYIACYLTAKGQNMDMKFTAGDGMFTLNIGNMSIVIDGSTGSRVVSLKLDDDEILGSKTLHPTYYGSTLWLSPHCKWEKQGFLDVSAYSMEFFNGVDLHLKSQNDSLLGFVFSKEFHGSLKDTSVVIQYSITNIAGDMQEVAPWEVTRVPTGGLAFFPKGSEQDLPKSNNRIPILAIQDSIGIIWYPYDSSLLYPQKIFMDGSEGWMAYVHNSVIFIKKFPVIKSDQTAPGEKNVELYVNKEKTYLELENQGAYEKLITGDSLLYEVKWYARRLPAGLKVEIGNQALLNYIRSVVKRDEM